MARKRNQPGGRGQPDLEPLINTSVAAFRRLDRRAQIVVLIVLAVAGVIAAVVYFQSHRPPQAGPAAPPPPPAAPAPSPGQGAPPALSMGAVNLLLGNPSGETADPANRNNYLMLKPYFALSYNDTTGTANWVSWRVAAADLGPAPRKPIFDADQDLPPGFYRATHKDYSGSGFDRGHLCPHGDRAAATEASFATFVMTNIIPQAPNVNQKAWANLEEYCRGLVSQQRQRLYVIAGPTGQGGRGSLGYQQTIAGSKVRVPAGCWKVVVAIPEAGGEDDLAKIDVNTRTLAVLMPNDNDQVGEPWPPYRTSPQQIEQRTGLKFFDRLPPDVAQALRRKTDTVDIPPPRPRNYGVRGSE